MNKFMSPPNLFGDTPSGGVSLAKLRNTSEPDATRSDSENFNSALKNERFNNKVIHHFKKRGESYDKMQDLQWGVQAQP